jgi:hypothetical protein
VLAAELFERSLVLIELLDQQFARIGDRVVNLRSRLPNATPTGYVSHWSMRVASMGASGPLVKKMRNGGNATAQNSVLLFSPWAVRSTEDGQHGVAEVAEAAVGKDWLRSPDHSRQPYCPRGWPPAVHRGHE